MDEPWNRPISKKNLQEGWTSWKCHCIVDSEEWWEVCKDGTEHKPVKCPYCENMTGRKDYEYKETDE